jgi:hypothetical protein
MQDLPSCTTPAKVSTGSARKRMDFVIIMFEKSGCFLKVWIYRLPAPYM